MNNGHQSVIPESAWRLSGIQEILKVLLDTG